MAVARASKVDRRDVSVVITNYNYGRFLSAAVDSAIGQRPRPEVIVVDDGSTDDSRALIASYGDEVVPVLKENGGQTSALNAGFEVSSGQVVVFLDGDDVLLPSAVSVLAGEMTTPGVAKAHWQMREIDEEGRLSDELIPPEELPAGEFADAVARDGPAAIESPPTSGNAWHRDFLEEIFPLPELKGLTSSGDDAYMGTLAPLFGRVVLIQTPLSAFRRHGESNYGSKPFDVRLAHDVALQQRLCEAVARVCRDRGLPVDRERWNRLSWISQLEEMVALLHAHVPPGTEFVLIDDNVFGLDETAGRRAVPLIARGGVYWGPPDDDATAIAALEAHVKNGVCHLALAPASRWWLDAYPEFFRRLSARAEAVVDNEYLTLYELPTPQARQ